MNCSVCCASVVETHSSVAVTAINTALALVFKTRNRLNTAAVHCSLLTDFNRIAPLRFLNLTNDTAEFLSSGLRSQYSTSFRNVQLNIAVILAVVFTKEVNSEKNLKRSTAIIAISLLLLFDSLARNKLHFLA